MATGHEDFSGYVEIQGEFEGELKTVAVDETGKIQTAWTD